MRKIPQVRGGAGIREQPAPPGDARIWPRPQPCPGPRPGAMACCAAARSGDGDTELQDINHRGETGGILLPLLQPQRDSTRSWVSVA